MLSELGPLPVLQRPYVSTRPQRGTESAMSGLLEEERLALLVSVEDEVKLSVREDDPAAHESVRLVAGDLLEALEELLVDQFRAELLSISSTSCRRGESVDFFGFRTTHLNELPVVDRLYDTIVANLSGLEEQSRQ